MLQAYSGTPSVGKIGARIVAPTLPRTDSVERLLKALREVSQLIDNWDGYDGSAPTRQCVENVCCVVNVLPDRWLRSSELTPNTNGTISLEVNARGVRGHLEIGDATYSWYWREGKSFDKRSGSVRDLLNCEARERDRL